MDRKNSYQEVELGIFFTSDPGIRELNRRWRKKDRPTDVLSFPLAEKGKISGAPSLGDVVISLETAQREAKKRKIKLAEELLRLMIHGILHLLGFDHEKVRPSEAQKMRRLERSLHQKLRGAFLRSLR